MIDVPITHFPGPRVSGWQEIGDSQRDLIFTQITSKLQTHRKLISFITLTLGC